MSILAPEKSILLQTAYGKLIDKYQHGLFRIELKFINASFPLGEILIEGIDELSILRNFHADYTEKLNLGIKLIPMDALKIIRAYQDLRCAITMTIVENNTGVILNEYDPIQWEYRALIENPGDKLKQLNSREFIKPEDEPDSDYYQSVRFPLTMQLIVDKMYQIRHKRVADGLGKETDPKKLIYYFSKIFGMDNVKVIEPDNTEKKDFVPIPPMLGFENAFGFIQENFGVYKHGLGQFVTDGTLYIFPKDDLTGTRAIKPGVVHFYKIPVDHLAGHDGFTKYEGDDIHMVCNQPLQVQDLSESHMENQGNSMMAEQADTAIDIHRTVEEDKVKRNEQRTLSVNSPNSNTAVKDMQNARYAKPQDNIYELMSQISSKDCVVVNIPILYAEPFKVFPNMPCVLHYEERDEYKTVNGIIVADAYALRYEGRPSDMTYGFQSTFTVKLIPDKKDGQPLASLPSYINTGGATKDF